MPVHEQVLIRIAFVEVVLLGNAAIRLFVMNVQTDAVMRRTQSFPVTHIHQALQGDGAHLRTDQTPGVSIQTKETSLIQIHFRYSVSVVSLL